ncbi:LysE family translocator [Nocardia sp. NPDC004750]
MVPASHLAAFAFAALVIVAIPGPNVLFAIGRAFTLGRRPALLSVLGATLGSTVPLTVVVLGLGTILAASAILFTVIKFVGAAYLIYLGVMAIHDRKQMAAALESAAEKPAAGRIVRQGFVVGATNPKAYVLLGAVLPQFAVPEAGALPIQLLLLGAVCLAIQFVSNSSWALLAGTARAWFVRSPRRLEAVGGTGGLMIIGLGASVALSGNY